MKLLFYGWRRCVMEHEHEVQAVEPHPGGGYRPRKKGPLLWLDPTTVVGKVNDLGLSGNFRMELHLTEDDAKTWMRSYIRSSPEDALRLFGEMCTEATIALADKRAE